MPSKIKFSLLALVNNKRKTVKSLKDAKGATRFYVRYTENGKRHEESVGDNFEAAQTYIKNRQAARTFEKETGQKLALPASPAALPVAPKKKIKQEIADWLAQKTLGNIRQSTLASYEDSLEHFVAFLSSSSNPREIESASDLVADDLRRFRTYLRKEKKFKHTTCYISFLRMMIFLKGVGVHLGIPHKEWGEPPLRKAEMYTVKELDAFWCVATKEEEEIYKSFLYTGFRDQEMANLTYGDINFRTSRWSVETKDNPGEDSDWQPKSKASVRLVPVPSFHTRAIHERMIRLGKTKADPVFPNASGKPQQHFWRDLQDLAKKAGVTGRVDVHKFRSTAATMWLRSGVDIKTVQYRLGHSNAKTMDRYIALANSEKEEVIHDTDKTFSHWAPQEGEVIPFRAAGD